ncbi:STAS domain-containing protein [Streptomyces sp. NPDC006314]|uniref:STAS domain-containing protein n=1 Tax=Streptomyces sp. NPDC006314 TaxID=3154475 RepID=UPI0033B2FA6B
MSDVPSVERTRSGRCLLARFSGEMDWVTGPMFRTEFLNLLDSGDRFIVLDLSGVPFCDSAGLNALLAARRRAVEIGTTLVLACVREQPRQLLKITCVEEILDVYDTAAEAKEALDG